MLNVLLNIFLKIERALQISSNYERALQKFNVNVPG